MFELLSGLRYPSTISPTLWMLGVCTPSMFELLSALRYPSTKSEVDCSSYSFVPKWQPNQWHDGWSQPLLEPSETPPRPYEPLSSSSNVLSYVTNTLQASMLQIHCRPQCWDYICTLKMVSSIPIHSTNPLPFTIGYRANNHAPFWFQEIPYL